MKQLTASKSRIREVLAEIKADMEADAKNFDGQPFIGRTVAQYFGNQGAAIAALATILDEVIRERHEDELLQGLKP